MVRLEILRIRYIVYSYVKPSSLNGFQVGKFIEPFITVTQIAFLKDALAKKDAELERFQKELKSKPMECVQEKVKVKPIETLSQSQPQRTSLEAIHSQGTRRQPLEDVRNLEVSASKEVKFDSPA